MTSIRRNAYTEFAGQWTATALALIMTVAISRLLTPEEIGLFSVTMALVVVVQSLQNVGTFEFLIQSRDLTLETRRLAFGLSASATLACSAALALGSGFIADLYDAPAMQGIVLIVAGNLLLNVASSPINAMLVRERRFFTMNVIRIVSVIAHTVAAIALALLGFSVYSLAWGMTAATVASVAMHVALAREHLLYRPRFRNSGRIFIFGSKAVGAGLLTQAQLVVTNLLLGYFVGLSATAMFDRANTVNTFYMRGMSGAVDSLATAEISAAGRAGRSVAAPFLATLRYTTAVAWPFFGLMALVAPAVIRLLFGSQWEPAIPLMTVLCVASCFLALNGPIKAVLITTGRPGLDLRVKAITLFLRVAFIGVAMPYGLMAVAYAMLAGSFANAIVSTVAVRAVAPFSLRDYVRTLAPSVVVAVCALLPSALMWSARHALELGNFPSLAVCGTVAGIGWLVGLRLAHHPLWDEVVLLLRKAVAGLPTMSVRGRS